jgi:alginate O-acetyltransferase complex protein AlgI
MACPNVEGLSKEEMYLLQLLTVYCLLMALIYWVLPDRWRSAWLTLATAVFLAWKAPVSLLILSGSTISSYWLLRLVPRPGLAVLLILVQNVGYFMFFKLGIAQQLLPPLDRFLPLGLSYYTFRQIHYALEWYKEKLGRHRFFDYVSYLFFLPTMLAGPIHRFPNFQRDRSRRRWNSAFLSTGLERILYGFSKIVLIGNMLLGMGMNSLVHQLLPTKLWLGTYLNTLEYTLSAYFIFAGFSDVAIGLSLLFGHRVIENFNYPYLAPNINEFWNRWHISLSSWVKDYVYFPLASLTRKPIMGILATMIVIGFWHELSWRYLVWGLFHGLGIAVWHWYKDRPLALRLQIYPWYHYLAIFITFHFVLLSFIFIREESWDAVQRVFLILFGLN